MYLPMVRTIALILLFTLGNPCCDAQKRWNKPIEISPYYSIGVSFSRLLNKQDGRFTSPPELNAFNYGVKLERQFSDSQPSIRLNMAISSGNLSVGSYYFIWQNHRGEGSGYTVIPNYTVWSFGIKKQIAKKTASKFKFTVESGIRLHFLNPSTNDTLHTYSLTLDTAIRTRFSYVNARTVTPIPYVGLGLDFSYKKFKAGILFWGQYAFTPVFQYYYEVKYGNYNFKSNVISYGAAAGANVYIKLLTF